MALETAAVRRSVLTLAFAAGLAGACAKDAPTAPGQGRVEQVGARDFKALAEQKGGIYLDVRTPDEVARGHIPNASVIDINDRRFDQKVALLQKDKPVFVYCASGARSSAAAEMMVRMGFSQVYNLLGGIGAWANEGYPLDRSTEVLADGNSGMAPDVFDFNVAAEERVLVDFHTAWCAPCRRMAPIVDALEQQWQGKVKVLRVDVDHSEALARREKISGVPVFVFYEGGKEARRTSGEVTRETLEALVARP